MSSRDLVLKLIRSDNQKDVEPLIKVDVEDSVAFLSSSDEELRAGAAFAIYMLTGSSSDKWQEFESSPSVLKALTQLLSVEQSAWVREHTIEAVGCFSEETADMALIDTFLRNGEYKAYYLLQAPVSENVKVFLQQQLLQNDNDKCFRAAQALNKLFFADLPLADLLKYAQSDILHRRLPALFALEDYSTEEVSEFLNSRLKKNSGLCEEDIVSQVIRVIRSRHKT